MRSQGVVDDQHRRQWQLDPLVSIEGFRGDLAAWGLIAFGLMYFAWGIRNAHRNKPHTHWHSHGGKMHAHVHTHHQDHAHVHNETVKQGVMAESKKIGPWAIFVIFVLGPCEPLIPLLMYPAAKESTLGLVAVTGVFGLVTMLTMLFAVYVSAVSLKNIRIPSMERYGHAIAGATIFGCGS